LQVGFAQSGDVIDAHEGITYSSDKPATGE
jgi:hypothetical protein